MVKSLAFTLPAVSPRKEQQYRPQKQQAFNGSGAQDRDDFTGHRAGSCWMVRAMSTAANSVTCVTNWPEVDKLPAGCMVQWQIDIGAGTLMRRGLAMIGNSLI